MTDKLHAVERWTMGLGAAVSLFALSFLGRDLGLGVSIGAAIMTLNVIAMRRVGESVWAVMRADVAGGRTRSLRALILFPLKMAALIAVIYLVVRQLHVNPIGLLIGLSVYPVAAVAVALTHVPTEEGVPLEDLNG